MRILSLVLLCCLLGLSVSIPLSHFVTKERYVELMDFRCDITVTSFQASAYTGESATLRVKQACNGDEYCSSMLGRYVEEIQSLSVEGHCATTICRAIQWCVAGRDYLSLPPGPETFTVDPVPLSALGFNGGCNVCQTLVGIVNDELSKSGHVPTGAEVRSLLDSVCNYFPSILKSTCVNALSQNGLKDKIVAAIEKRETPAKVCQSAGLCTVPSDIAEEAAQELHVAAAPGQNCLVCRTAIQAAQGRFNLQNATALGRQLIQICNQTGIFRQQCNDLFRGRVRTLLALLQSGITDPLTICTRLGVCITAPPSVRPTPTGWPSTTSWGPSTRPPSTWGPSPRPSPSWRPPSGWPSPSRPSTFSANGVIANSATASQPACQVCQWGVSSFEAYISQTTTEEELGAVFQELCTVLPGRLSSFCQNFVIAYMPQAINYLVDNLTPPVICQRLRLCSPPPSPAPAKSI